MEALYDRMAESMDEITGDTDRRLAANTLAWATCSLRLLTMAELSQAMEKDAPQILDFQKSIDTLCGGFVVIDSGGKVAMIHQTAREYLLSNQNGPPRVDRRAAHGQIFLRCMQCLMMSGLRGKIGRNQMPEFFDYASTS